MYLLYSFYGNPMKIEIPDPSNVLRSTFFTLTILFAGGVATTLVHSLVGAIVEIE